jgi:hypothetical protein
MLAACEPVSWWFGSKTGYGNNRAAYIVAGENQRSQRYDCRVVPEAVDYLCDRTRGRNITSEGAGGVIAPVAEQFKLPYTYGDGLRYSGQYVLLAAVALGRATVTNEGRSYVYSIKG